MRTLIGAVVVLAFAGFVSAAGQKDEKIDGKKLVGKWEPADGKAQIVVEFTDKGKVILAINLGDKNEKVEGTYKLDGNKLEMVIPFGGKDAKESVTITKLTDEEIVTRDAKDKEEKFKKVKAK